MSVESRVESLLDKLTPEDKKVVSKFFMDRELHPKTQSLYLAMILSFRKFINKPILSATKDDVQLWLDHESKRKLKNGKIGIAKSTLNTHKRSLKTFYRWTSPDGKLPDCVEWINRIGTRRGLPDELLSAEEIRSMIDVASTVRDKALLSSLYESGMRAGEFLSLLVRSVSFDRYGAVVVLPRGAIGLKTGQRRLRLIDSSPYLGQWINHHPQKNDPDAPLWLTRRGQALRTTYLGGILKIYARKAGIKKRVYPHLFRHSRLTALAKILSDGELKVYAGWTAGSSMAQTYVHLSGADLDHKLLESRGLLEPEEKDRADGKVLMPLKCPRCDFVNTADSKYCGRCSLALGITAVKEIEHDDALMAAILRDPGIRKLIAQKIKSMPKD